MALDGWRAGASCCFVEACEALGFDSLWLSDRVVSAQMSLEPLTALAAAAGRTHQLKFGTSVLALAISQTRLLLAKELATIDFISEWPVVFPAVGLGGEDDREYESAGVRKTERPPAPTKRSACCGDYGARMVFTHQGRSYRPHLSVPYISHAPSAGRAADLDRRSQCAGLATGGTAGRRLD